MNGLYSSVHCTTVLLLMNIPGVRPDGDFPVLDFRKSGWCSFERGVAQLAAGFLFKAHRKVHRLDRHKSRSLRLVRMLWSAVVGAATGVVVGGSTQDDDLEVAKAELDRLIDSHAHPKLVDVSGDEPRAINITEPPSIDECRQSVSTATFTNGKSEHSQVSMREPSLHQ